MVLPAAILGLGGFNLIQNFNQQQLIDEKQETIENVETRLLALTSRVAVIEANQPWATVGKQLRTVLIPRLNLLNNVTIFFLVLVNFLH